MEISKFQVSDWSINAAVGGNGPPILFLHGIGASWQWWGPALEAFSRDFTVCGIDLPGSGDSSPLNSPPPPESYAELVEGTVRFLKKGPVVIVGHSLGGYVALNAAIHDAKGIRGLFLVAPAGFGPIRNKYFRILSIPGVGDLLARSGRLGLPLLLQSLVYKKQVVDLMAHWVDTSTVARSQFLYQLRLGLDELGRTSSSFIIEEVPDLPMPMQLLWGQHDSVFSLEAARQAQRVLGSAPLCIFRYSGHCPQLEEAASFNEVLRAFVARL